MDFLNPLIDLYKELSDAAKLVVFLVLMAAVLGLWVWKVLGWRREQVLRRNLKANTRELAEVTQERDQLLSRFEALDQVDTHVWTKPDINVQNRFVPATERSTRFLAICNLKGGVG